MIAAIIDASIRQRGMVLLACSLLVLWGLYVLNKTPIDAIPDLSDVQVIVKTSYPGQAPQVVQDQITYPLTTALLAVPGAKTVRGYSFFGDSYIYVLFDDDIDMYWARSRVLEYLSQVADQLPSDAQPKLGPDATGVGWVYSYALVDRSAQRDLAELTSLQNWFLKFELQSVPGVSEIATVGGMVKQYQVTVDPHRLRALGLPLSHITMSIRRSNRETGASVIDLAEAENLVRVSGYIESVDELRLVPLGLSNDGTPLLLGDVADIKTGPQMRRGVAELDGEGEVVGGIVVMRSGENAAAVIEAVKTRLDALSAGLPEGVEIVTTYDRSKLINAAVENLYIKLLEEFLVVSLILTLFLFHLRSSLVVIISLPIGILAAFVVMYYQGINANIMSLGGIAIAIGAMVDGAIVMIENVHKHLERGSEKSHWEMISSASKEVGPPLFFSLLIITMSFIPVFALEAQEGKLFSPLAFTKTYAMAAAAGLAITLVPVLMGYLIKGKITPEHKNPLNRFLTSLYRPLVQRVLRHAPWVVLGGVIVIAIGFWPMNKIGTEFMPPLDEGDLMYMPTTYAGISIGKAREVLQQTDRLIKTVPEVLTVFGKVGRADTATDPAPLTMIETIIQLKPKEQWRPGVTTESLQAEFSKLINFPGLSDAWVMPIKTRIDMLSTGIKTPVGIKVSGPDLMQIQKIGERLEEVLADLPGTASVYSERVSGGRYLDVQIDRFRAARYGLTIDDIQSVIRAAVGGMNVSQSTEGLERYPINLRYPQQYRDSIEQLREMPLVAANGAHLALADVAEIRYQDGPPGIKSENARLTGWTLVDIEQVDIGTYVKQAQARVKDQVELPPGYSVNWSGQYEYMINAEKRLRVVVPLTLGIIVLLLFLSFRNIAEVLIILGTLPFALGGGIWTLYLLGYNFSVAVGVGFIALAGVAVEIGVLMLVYLNQAWAHHQPQTREELQSAVFKGASARLRPIVMTFTAIVAGLVPIMYGSGTGSEIMQRIAGPMIGGMISTLLLSLFVIPAVYQLWRGYSLPNSAYKSTSANTNE